MLFYIFILSLFVPETILLVPNVVTVTRISQFFEAIDPSLKWINNWPALVVPFLSSTFGIFLLTQGKSPVDMLHRLLQEPSAIEAADAFPKPLIAMINGYCLGSGNELAMACDIRIASEDAKFGQPEINLGMMPGGGATQRLPRLIGLGKALWLMYSGALLDSSEAMKMGLVDLVVPAKQLKARVMTLAQVIASKSPVALAMIKEAARASVRAPLDDGIRHEQSLASVIFSSKDMQEGLKAFLEKRPPTFTGQ